MGVQRKVGWGGRGGWLGVLALGALVAATGCAHGPRSVRTDAELTTHAYADDQGLSVLTAGARVAQPLTGGLVLEVKAVVDDITVEPPAPAAATPETPDPGDPDHEHGADEVDAITSASVLSGGGGRVRERRFEGALGLGWVRTVGGAPMRLGAAAQVSQEPDYTAFGLRLHAQGELNQRNTVVGGFLVLGRDTMSPTVTPPGEAALWPGRHGRVGGGATLSQVVSRTLVMDGGVAGSYQSGRLSSPYRRALVQTTLFPEALPDARGRFTAFVGGALWLRAGSALHLRQGAYLDTWGVKGVSPELALVQALGGSTLATLRYSLYRQWPARFYSPRFTTLPDVRSGDVRLGALLEHRPGLALQLTLWREGSARVALEGDYELSHLRYLQLEGARRTRAHVASFSLRATL